LKNTSVEKHPNNILEIEISKNKYENLLEINRLFPFRDAKIGMDDKKK
jgi:hypothetical protein